MFISRKDYDKLVSHYWSWMDLHWQEYKKSWRLGGVYVTRGNIENLVHQIAYIKTLDKKAKIE